MSTTRKPLVIINGEVQEIPTGDITGQAPPSGPGGANQTVQFNDSTVLEGDSSFLWNKTTKQLNVSTSGDGIQINNNKVWHAGNDGTGSGLDADLIDGLEATSLVRTDASSTISGFNLTISDSNNVAGILNTRELVSTGKARALNVLQVENGSASQPSSGGELSLSNTSNNPFVSFHKTDGTRTGFAQSDFPNTKFIIGQEQNNATLIFRNLNSGSPADYEVVHAGNHTTIVDAEGTAVALAIALG